MTCFSLWQPSCSLSLLPEECSSASHILKELHPSPGTQRESDREREKQNEREGWREREKVGRKKWESKRRESDEPEAANKRRYEISTLQRLILEKRIFWRIFASLYHGPSPPFFHFTSLPFHFLSFPSLISASPSPCLAIFLIPSLSFLPLSIISAYRAETSPLSLSSTIPFFFPLPLPLLSSLLRQLLLSSPLPYLSLSYSRPLEI